jgi:hypothetical protein
VANSTKICTGCSMKWNVKNPTPTQFPSSRALEQASLGWLTTLAIWFLQSHLIFVHLRRCKVFSFTSSGSTILIWNQEGLAYPPPDDQVYEFLTTTRIVMAEASYMIFLKHVFDEIRKELCHLNNASTYAGFATVWHCHLQERLLTTIDETTVETTVREKLYDLIVGASNQERAKLEYDLGPISQTRVPEVCPYNPRLLSMISFDHINLEISQHA